MVRFLCFRSAFVRAPSSSVADLAEHRFLKSFISPNELRPSDSPCILIAFGRTQLHPSRGGRIAMLRNGACPVCLRLGLCASAVTAHRLSSAGAKSNFQRLRTPGTSDDWTV